MLCTVFKWRSIHYLPHVDVEKRRWHSPVIPLEFIGKESNHIPNLRITSSDPQCLSLNAFLRLMWVARVHARTHEDALQRLKADWDYSGAPVGNQNLWWEHFTRHAEQCNAAVPGIPFFFKRGMTMSLSRSAGLVLDWSIPADCSRCFWVQLS